MKMIILTTLMMMMMRMMMMMMAPIMPFPITNKQEEEKAEAATPALTKSPKQRLHFCSSYQPKSSSLTRTDWPP
jgi:hypothetical protein